MTKPSHITQRSEHHVTQGSAKVVEAQPELAHEEAKEEPTVQEETSTFAPLFERLSALEARLLRLEQMAHTEHQMVLGEAEIQAIGNALERQIKQGVVSVLKSHLGIAPPPVRGDGS